jgi:hypothetical protein
MSSRLSAGDAFETTDGNRLSVDAAAATCRLAGPVARAAEDAGKDVGFAVEEVGLRVASLRDQPNVLGHVRVGGTRPLAIDHFMVVLRIRNVRGRARSWSGS